MSRFKMYALMIFSFAIAFLLSANPTQASTTEVLQPASSSEAGVFSSLRVGSQGTGGVTHFNGTIINDTTTNEGAGIPITMGDDLRVDGVIWRGPSKGTSDKKALRIADSLHPAMDDINDIGAGNMRWQDLYLSGSITADSILVDAVDVEGRIDGDDIITSAQITDGAVTTDDIANGAINSQKISDGAVTTDDIADGTISTDDLGDNTVNPDKISGSGGANIPIAYGHVDDSGNLLGGTSNITTYPGGGSITMVSIDGISFDPNEQFVIVTPGDVTKGLSPRVSDAAGTDWFTVDFWSQVDNGWIAEDFYFVVYQI